MSVTDERIQELNQFFVHFISQPGNVDAAADEIYNDLFEEVLMGFVFDVHRMIKTGSSDIEEGIPDDESYAIVDVPGLDVFGQHPIKKSQECSCPNCDRGVAASRFATHLEKCMGMGRNSSRIASRRIANNSKDSTFSGIISDDDDDVDWSVYSDKRKRRKDRNSFRKIKQLRSTLNQKNGNEPLSDFIFLNDSTLSNFENLSTDDKKTLLQQVCGVVSEHTRKLCTKSMRCPQHTDDQRKEIRTHLESSNYSHHGGVVSSEDVNLLVDIDTFEETDGQNFREFLGPWDREGSSHSSPADSASTTSTSSMSKKKDCKSKGKVKGHRRERTSPVSQVE